jgi:hypothetical protein
LECVTIEVPVRLVMSASCHIGKGLVKQGQSVRNGVL